MDPRKFQQAAREFFAADNALRAAPEPTDKHLREYVGKRAMLDVVTEQQAQEMYPGADDEETTEEEQNGSD